MRTEILLAFFLAVPATGQVCSPDATQQALTEVHTLQRQLFAIPEPKDDLPLDAPQAARTDVPRLMSALSSTVERSMYCEASSALASKIEQHLVVLLGANRLASATEKRNGYPDHTYGDSLTVRVSPIAGHPDVLAVDLSFSVGCGDDQMLLLFRRNRQFWQQELDWHSDKYTQPSNAFGDFFLYTLVPGADSSLLVAVAYGTPWCTSRMSALHVDLLRPADATRPQALLAHLNEGYSRFEHMPDVLKQTPDGFQLRVWDDSLDFDNLFTRPRTYRFRTTANRLERVQPIADNARDFVDAWLQAPWVDSQKWTETPTPSLQRVRDRFDYSLSKSQPEVEFGAVRACSSAPRRFQVEIDLSEFSDVNGARPVSRDLPALFAEVRQNQNSFTMIEIGQKPDPTCTGSDLMRKRNGQTSR